MTELSARKCIPCSGGIPPLGVQRIDELRPQVPGWEVIDGHHLHRRWKLKDFQQALALVNRIGEVAERENHHPNICFTWGEVEVTIYTHKIDGLTESDFILAAKLSALDG